MTTCTCGHGPHTHNRTDGCIRTQYSDNTYTTCPCERYTTGDTMNFTDEEIDELHKTSWLARESTYFGRAATEAEYAHYCAVEAPDILASERAGIRAVAEAVAEPLLGRIAELEQDSARWQFVSSHYDYAVTATTDNWYAIRAGENSYLDNETIDAAILESQSPANTGAVANLQITDSKQGDLCEYSRVFCAGYSRRPCKCQ